MTTKQISIVMLGASGAVGGCVLQNLLNKKSVERITILGRTPIPNLNNNDISIEQHKINIFESSSYISFLPKHNVAICTLGVGEPSKISKEEFVKIDKTAVIEFAEACKKAGVHHFELLSSVGISIKSSSFYLRTKAELVEELEALNFERLSIFQPSMILTPVNRYGFTQALTLKVWPLLKPILLGKLKKYRGVPVDILGKSIALNILERKTGFEILQWDDFYSISEKQSEN
jgi:nucleoside-diphosphate-sugar epimerase